MHPFGQSRLSRQRELIAACAEHPAERSPPSRQRSRVQTQQRQTGDRLGNRQSHPRSSSFPISFPRRSPTASSQTGISTGTDLARFGRQLSTRHRLTLPGRPRMRVQHRHKKRGKRNKKEEFSGDKSFPSQCEIAAWISLLRPGSTKAQGGVSQPGFQQRHPASPAIPSFSWRGVSLP